MDRNIRMILRPWDFQLECLDATWSAVDEGYQRFPVVLPTGSGKTVIFAHLANEAHHGVRSHRYRVLILVERDELVNQTVRKLHSIAPDLTIGVIKGARKEFHGDVTVASVQTLSRQPTLDKISPERWNFIIVDECHHVAADSYQRILRHFGAWHVDFESIGNGDYVEVPHTIVVGFTATLTRGDSKKLGDTFQKIPDRPKGAAYHKDLLWMIRHGYLVNPTGKEITIELDLGEVGRQAGDYQVGQLGDSLIQAHAGSVVADFIRDEVPDRQIMVFAPNIASAEECLSVLKLRGFAAESVYGSTPIEDRALTYKRLDVGETQIFVNVGVGVEGFDKPHISCVILLHVTQSAGRFIQMVGRALRLSNGHSPASPYPWMRKPKTDAIVAMLGAQNGVRLASMVDLTETVIKEILPGESLLEAAEREAREADESPVKKMVDDWLGADRVRVMDVDLFANESRFRFRRTAGKGYRYIPTKEWLVAVYPQTTAPDTLYAVGTIYIGKGKHRKGQTVVKNVEEGYALAWAEDQAELLDPIGTATLKDASWRKKKHEPATALQLIKATQLHIQVPPGATKVEVSDLIDNVVSTKALDWYTPKEPRPVEED